MLKSVSLHNVAVAESLTLDLMPGLNVITGETGAGKSLIVDALKLLGSMKSDASLVRTGAREGQVTAVFELPEDSVLLRSLRELGLSPQLLEGTATATGGSDLILRRSVHHSGRSKAFINDLPVSVRTLAQTARELIDVSSQFEHQKLFDADYQGLALDRFTGSLALRGEFERAHRRLQTMLDELASAQAESQLRKREAAVCRAEVAVIEEAGVSQGEWDDLQQAVARGERSENAHRLCAEVRNALDEGEFSSSALLKAAARSGSRLARLLSGTGLEFSQEKFAAAQEALAEIINQVADIEAHFDVDAAEIARARERLDEFNALFARFGDGMSALETHVTTCRAVLAREQEAFERESTLAQACAVVLGETLALASRLSHARQGGLSQLSQAISEELALLGMPDARFVCELQEHELRNQPLLPASVCALMTAAQVIHFGSLTGRGFERVAFLLSTNAGLAPGPLAKVASGGELSRLLLAIKSVVLDRAESSVHLFDEVDSGLSGQVASKVARKLADFCSAADRQAIVVTHLPQVAAFAGAHFIVSKAASLQGHVSSRVKRATEDESLHEIAAMISGDNVSPEGWAQARTLRHEARRQKLKVSRGLAAT